MYKEKATSSWVKRTEAWSNENLPTEGGLSQPWQFPLWNKGIEPHIGLLSLGDLHQEDEPL